MGIMPNTQRRSNNRPPWLDDRAVQLAAIDSARAWTREEHNQRSGHAAYA
jgi:hypothetical protein